MYNNYKLIKSCGQKRIYHFGCVTLGCKFGQQLTSNYSNVNVHTSLSRRYDIMAKFIAYLVSVKSIFKRYPVVTIIYTSSLHLNCTTSELMEFGFGQNSNIVHIQLSWSKHNVLGSIIAIIINRFALARDFDFELTIVDRDTNLM